MAAPLRVEALLIASAARSALVRTGMGPERAKAAAGELASQAGGAMLARASAAGWTRSVPRGSGRGAGGTRRRTKATLSAVSRHAGELLQRRRPRAEACARADRRLRSRLAAARAARELHAAGAIAVDMESAWLAPRGGRAAVRGRASGRWTARRTS